MFSFGFSTAEDSSSSEILVGSKSKLAWKASREVTFDCDPLLPPSYLYCQGDVSLELASSDEVMKILQENEESCAQSADSQHSDLLPSIYEGGLKVWECTDDLMKFISEPAFKPQIKDKNILDLGCGAGALGIFALLNGASSVHFQDYNEEVLKYFTRPNIVLNLPGENLDKKIKFFSGDWESFVELLPDCQYDFIFTSETIYNQDCYPKLLKLFKSMLTDDGKVLLAAKSYYFGVGGGTRQFEEAVAQDSKLKSDVVWKCEEGLHREILQIQKS